MFWNLIQGPYLNKTRTHLQKVLGDDNVLMVKFAGEVTDMCPIDHYYAAYSKIWRGGILVGLRRYCFFGKPFFFLYVCGEFWIFRYILFSCITSHHYLSSDTIYKFYLFRIYICTIALFIFVASFFKLCYLSLTVMFLLDPTWQ